MKATPKSCSCRTCRRGKGTSRRKRLMKFEERAFRHAMNRAARDGEALRLPAPYGDYRD